MSLIQFQHHCGQHHHTTTLFTHMFMLMISVLLNDCIYIAACV